MTGAKLQLYSQGKENSYLTKNPQISFFKKVYHKYSNFAIQTIDLQFDFIGNLSYDNTTKIKLKLDKNGDLINTLFLEVNLPAIFSDKDTNKIHLHWANNIGDILIKNARIIVGGIVVEEYDSEYMFIYNNISSSTDKLSKLNKLICKDKLSYNQKNYNAFTHVEQTGYLNSLNNIKPSMASQNIHIPIPFWFHRNIGSALPISSLLYHDAIIEIELRPLKELLNYHDRYTITTDSPAKTFNRTDVKGVNIPNKSGNTITHEQVLSFFENNRWNINPVLNVDYIFLDNQLKKDFQESTLQYIVEPITKLILKDRTGMLNIRDDPTNAMPHHPCKEIIIASRRNDVINTNNWLNFTNKDNEHQSNEIEHQQTYYYQLSRENSNNNNSFPTPIDYLVKFTDSSINHTINEIEYTIDDSFKLSDQDIQDLLDNWNYRNYADIPSINKNNYKFFSDNIIENISFDFDETNRVSKKDTSYFTKIQSLMHHNNILDGVNLYSFAIHPDKYDPSGSSNLGEIKNIRFEIKLKDIETELSITEKYKYDVLLYMKYFNVLEIKSGMAELLFKI